jgi:hypothetical protein
MNREQRKDLLEAIGFVALIASLSFVGIETRNSAEQAEIANQSMKDASMQAVTAQLMDWHLALASNEDLSRLVTLAESSPLEANDNEWARFTTMAIPLYGMWEWSFLSYRGDSIENAQWLAIEAYFETLTCKSGYRRFMEMNTAAFSAQFVDYYETEKLPVCAEE